MLTGLLLLLSPLVLAGTYPRTESWSGSGFLNGFRYPVETYDNTTNGDVFWATPANSSLIYVNDAGRVVMKVDNTTFVPYNEKRYTPKLYSKSLYDIGTVWIMDAVHLPYGCSVWPAFWTHGENWPIGGEIDIMEGINQQTTNQVALHTDGSSCIASSSGQLGTAGPSNCSVGANNGAGCTTQIPDTASYGAGFAAAGGGVYITEFASDAIRIWFKKRSDVPSSVSASATSIDTSTLGTPYAEYLSTTCSINTLFSPQNLILDITLCGSWAGVPSILEATCGALNGTNTCYTQYVINDAGATYANAYFEINYINVFSTSGTASTTTSSGGGTGGATTTVTSGPGTGSVSAAISSRAAADRRVDHFSLPSSLMAVVLAGALGAIGLLL